MGAAVLAFLFEFAQQLLLPLAQIDRGLDNRLDEHVAAGSRPQHRHPLRPEAELVPRLRSRRHRNARPAAIHRRDLDRAAERRRRDRERHPAMDVGAVALEDPMGGDADEDEEIARRSAADADLAFSPETDADAVLDPGRYTDRQRLLAPRPALAAACLAGIVDHPSGTLAAGAGPLDGEEALLGADASAAVASRAGYRLGPSLGAGPVALLAGDQVRHPDRRLLAAEGLLERNLEVVAQVVAAARPALAAPSAHELAHRLVRRRHGRSDHRRRAFDRP